MTFLPVDSRVQRRQRRRNRAQAALLFAGMVAVPALLAWLLLGPVGLLWVGLLGAAALVLRPRIPPDWVLRAYGARPLGPHAAPRLHALVQALAARAGLARAPGLYYVPTSMLNAFAVGARDGPAAVGVTDGLLRHLSERELVGVLAHELCHIRSDDLWIMTLADAVGRLTHALAYAGALLLVAGLPLHATGSSGLLLAALALVTVPTVVTLLQLALSRSREYDADLEAARLTGDPAGLASALRKLERHEGRIWERILVPHRRGPDPLLLRTHPPTDERVRRLLSLVPQRAQPLTSSDATLPAPRSAPVTRPARLRYPGVWW